MSNLKVDRDNEYMKKMWGTSCLATDYFCNTNSLVDKTTIQEIMHDEIPKNKFKLSEENHQKIRNDVDYDDWEYGTEPTYGRSWK
jgi:hypothetical protein